MQENRMNIVIIDDGVNEEYFKLKTLRHDLEIDKKQKLSIRQSKNEQICSHGTICAAIILKYAPDAIISSIKVLNPADGRGMKGHLVMALQWCLENHVQLINLSIGSTQFQDFREIRSIISELYRKGCIIVAAYNNRDIYTMPASLECTIGVKCNAALKTPSYKACESKIGYFMEASGEHELINFLRKKIISQSANSYAAPYITAIVYNIMSGNNRVSFKDIQKVLFENENSDLCYVPDFIDEAVVVDLTENEMIELFYFPVIEVYNEKTIHEIEKINDFVNIVILAEPDYCMAPLMNALKKIKQYIRGIYCCFKSECVDFEKWDNLYDSIWQEQYYLNKFTCLNYEYKNLKTSNLLDLRAHENTRMGDNIDIPLIYIYGRRESLIKLLLNLEDRFLKAGYAVKVIGEFQRAYLYGFDYIDYIENRKSVILNVSSWYAPDLIICGIDSQIITHDEEDLCFDLECKRQLYGQEKDFTYCPDAIYNRIISAFE